MANDYFVHNNTVVDGTTALAAQINDIAGSIEDGFDKLPTPDEILNRSIGVLADTGTASNAIVLTTGRSLAAYATYMTFSIVLANDITTAPTINVDGLGAKNVLNIDTATAGDIVEVVYDGSVFRAKSSFAGATSVTSFFEGVHMGSVVFDTLVGGAYTTGWTVLFNFGLYQVTHNLGLSAAEITRTTIAVTPYTNDRAFNVVSESTNDFVIQFYNPSTLTVAQQADFTFEMKRYLP